MTETDPLRDQRDAADRTLATLEALVQVVVQRALDEVAADYARFLREAGREDVQAALDGTELRRIAELWAERLPPILAALLAVFEAAVRAVLRRFSVPMPPEMEDLAEKWLEDPFSVPEQVRMYLTTANNRLVGVGDRLWEAAREALAAGNDAGEGIDQLRRRLQQMFAQDSVQLGRTRAERIARTEVISVWNQASLDAAQLVPADARPPYKSWLATVDERTRPAHWQADGQTVPIQTTFDVGGEALMFPGDPTGSPSNIIQCRCTATFGYGDRPAADAGRQFLDDDEIARVIRYFEEQGIVRDAHQPSDVTADATEPAPPRRWSTPGPAALAFENQETGDGRVFAAGALYWDGGPWPLQYADEMLTGHEGAELAGAIETLGRDGDRIPATGVLYPSQASGAAAIRLLEEGAPLGVSVDLDDVDLEIVQFQGKQIASEQVVCSACKGGTTTASAAVGSPFTATSQTPNTASADAAGNWNISNRSSSGSVTRGGYITPATHGSTAAGYSPPTHAVTVERNSTGGKRGFATTAEATAGHTQTERSDAATTSPAPTGSKHQKPNGSSPSKAASAQSATQESLSSTATAEILPTSTTAIQTNATERSSASPATQGSETSGTTLNSWNAQLRTCACTKADESDDDDGEVILLASLAAASVLALPDGGHAVRATHVTEWTAAGRPVRATHAVEWTVDADSRVAAADLQAALTAAGVMTAAAGDADTDTGQVLKAERTGDMVMRITRARVRGATLVSMPAFAAARIVLDADELAAACGDTPPGGRMRDVIMFVASSPTPVNATQVADALSITTVAAREYLARAALAGRITRLARGLYVAAATLPEARPDLVAAMSGDLELPIHDDRDAEWDGDAAASRVLEWATGSDGQVDAERLAAAFLWRDPDADPETLAAYKLGIAAVFDRDGNERLEIVPATVFAVAAVLQGGRGGADIPAAEQTAIRERVERLYARLAEAFDDPTLTAPWADDQDPEDDDVDELEASAWTAMRELPPMPAAWFREPSAEELPPDSGGVHYRNGRLYGWVAQAGEPHVGMPGRNLTIESLGDIDLTHFLRARFQLDDSSEVRAGAMTMNVGHHRDGAECETTSCQFDDTRTVAAVITVGMNDRGMWFSGAAMPWLAQTDVMVLRACQPSYHMKQGRDGRWQLRAVLSVPVPGHSSPLLASAVVERANLALTASAALARQGRVDRAGGKQPVLMAGQADAASPVDLATLAAALAPAVVDEMERRQAAREEIERMAAELESVRAELAATTAAPTTEGV